MTTETAAEKTTRHHGLPFPKPPKPVLIALLVILGVVIVVSSASAAVHLAYQGRIYPHVTIAGVPVGGLDTIAANEKVQNMYDAMLDKGLAVQFGDDTATIALRGAGDDVTYNLIDINVGEEVDAAYRMGRSGSFLEDAAMPLLYALGFHTEQLDTLTLHEEELMDAIREAFPDAENPGSPTDFVITENKGTYTVDVVAGEQGTVFADAGAMTTLAVDVADGLTVSTLTLWTVVYEPDTTIAQAETLEGDVRAALENAPYTLSYTPENRTEPETWTITADDLATWLIPGTDEDGALILTLHAEDMETLLADIHATLDVAPQDAKFIMENERVTEFAPSHDGITVNDDETIAAAAAFLGTPEADIMIAVDRVTPDVPTESVNDLGIKEILGIGTSDFKGSPSNRIGNIKNGARLLDGLLVAPGETISLIEQLSPFTYENGYLPELVIKGDEIKPEMGGGLCQIGTTTFRAVMNSGLKVTERRNHSLVVSYYNDPGNGNPGTDATIYEPSPDFKFTNDTANYVLLNTEVDEVNKKLYFTFWGTSDGREGSYEPPQVLSWNGYGATQYKETTSLAPGATKCQAAHPGATTTFTYTVRYADGTTYEEEFTSVYRSLPQICLVGKEEGAEEAPTDESADAPLEADIATETTASDTVPLE